MNGVYDLQRLSLQCDSYQEELSAGSTAMAQVKENVRAAGHRAIMQLVAANFESRIQDWKGHRVSDFGELLLVDLLTITMSDVERQYHVYLFKKILLCCRSYTPPVSKKSWSSTKKLEAVVSEEHYSLFLKGRIFVNNIAAVAPRPRSRMDSNQSRGVLSDFLSSIRYLYLPSDGSVEGSR